MEGLNDVTLLGTVGQDPETNVISETQKVSKFRLATNESYKDKQGNKVENTSWHTLEAWGYTSDLIANYVKKGQNLLVKGKLKYDSYEDKQYPGRKVYSTKIVVDKITFIPGGTNQNNQQQQQPVAQQPVAQQPAYQQPVAQQPVYQQPVAQQPVYQQPVAQQPVQQQPVQQQPVQSAQPVQQQVNQYMTDDQFMQDMQKSPDDLPF